MDELAKENIIIEDMIYEIRGKQVMLDSDLARLYQVETKRINEAVKRNMERFPEDFYFELSNEEHNLVLRSQNATLRLEHGKFSKYGCKVFTEQGVAMLSIVLKSQIAYETSIKIMRAFVSMRRYITNNINQNTLIEKQIINNSERIDTHEKRIDILEQSFKKFEEKKIVNEIYFNGQIYDAYSKILDILY